MFSAAQLPGFAALTAPQWGFGARTGGYDALQKIDNLRINAWPHVVTTLADAGAGSLRAALGAAASADCPGPSQVHFSPTIAGQSVILSTEIPVSDIDGVLVDATPSGVYLSGGAGLNRLFYNLPGSTMELAGLTLTGGHGTGSVMSGNGGAILNEGVLTLAGATFTGNTAGTTPNALEQGGAIYSHTGATLAASHCTFAGNECISNRGGAISSRGTLRLLHCTISGNTARIDSGGVRCDGPVTVTHSIISGNSLNTGAIRDLYVGATTLTRAGVNIVPSYGADGGAVVSGAVFLTGDPLLAPLADYGGATWTMALRPFSAARNAAIGSRAFTDQRGFPMVSTPDVGAYEAGTHLSFAAWIWEFLPAAATVTQHLATADYDGDGQTNAEEYNYLTDPGSGSSLFTPTAIPGGAGIAISFPSAHSRIYTLQMSTSLAPGSWSNAPAAAITGDGGVKEFTVPLTARRVYYRIQAAP